MFSFSAGVFYAFCLLWWSRQHPLVSLATLSFWVSQISEMRKHSNPYLQNFSEMEHLTYTAHGPHSDILLLFLNNFLRTALFLSLLYSNGNVFKSILKLAAALHPLNYISFNCSVNVGYCQYYFSSDFLYLPS